MMEKLNNLPPSIEPTATGHIVEQIAMARRLLDKGLAYEANGSIYFDVSEYLKTHPYGELSGRVVEELQAGSRSLDGQDEKQDPADFALWKKASPAHIMRWESPWGEGFPGWHLECSVMSSKYLGESFDIHGGGMDLKFPHHECEIAQSKGDSGKEPVKYWLHANMLTVNGAKMSKSANNSILPDEIFAGNHPLLTQAYSPMVLRFAFLQAHYRSTMDLSDEALQAAGKGYRKLMNGLRVAKAMTYEADPALPKPEKQEQQLDSLVQSIYRGMNDDFNTAVAIAGLFNLLKKINAVHLGQTPAASYSHEAFERMRSVYVDMVENVLGLREEAPSHYEKAVSVILDEYRVAKEAKDYAKVDAIRAHFKDMGIAVKDMRDRIEWAYEE
jgi:cysteinyl-tRNA synthetase